MKEHPAAACSLLLSLSAVSEASIMPLSTANINWRPSRLCNEYIDFLVLCDKKSDDVSILLVLFVKKGDGGE